MWFLIFVNFATQARRIRRWALIQTYLIDAKMGQNRIARVEFFVSKLLATFRTNAFLNRSSMTMRHCKAWNMTSRQPHASKARLSRTGQWISFLRRRDDFTFAIPKLYLRYSGVVSHNEAAVAKADMLTSTCDRFCSYSSFNDHHCSLLVLGSWHFHQKTVPYTEVQWSCCIFNFPAFSIIHQPLYTADSTRISLLPSVNLSRSLISEFVTVDTYADW